ncbi:MAG: MoxR family ATPase [Pseudomonadota bacterium]
MDSAVTAEIKQYASRIEMVLAGFSSRIVGQTHVGQRLLMALLADGHVLLEGLPGLAKTTAIKTMSELTGLKFSRIQFTPDLLPADVTGTQVYDPKQGTFHVRKGPLFANLVLADEINRAPAKVQSALLEAMQERQITIGGETFTLEQPFLVMATQNPVDQEGTYPLPEAQVDRFMFKVKVSYGTERDEIEMLRRASSGGLTDPLKSVLSRSDIVEGRQLAAKVRVSDKIHQYIVSLVFATRDPARFKITDVVPWIETGASPRASLFLEKASRVNAMLMGRDYVTPQDIKDVAVDILRHRVTLSYAAEAEQISSDRVVQKILDRVEVP